MTEDSRIQKDFGYALRQMRHLYEQMLHGHVKNTADAAKGLLGPAIEQVEKLQALSVHLEAVCNGAHNSNYELGALDLNVGDVIDADDVKLHQAHVDSIHEPLAAYRRFIREM